MRKPAKATKKVKAPVAPIKDRVVEVRMVEVAPEVQSTRVVETLDYGWVVGCESEGCAHRVLVANADWRPVSFADPDGPATETRYSAPRRRRCSLHPMAV